ncbi:MAG: SPOR domain-containing protein [Bacteroidales bacterium]|nr:SPOR domain-containing protein [Bacteroidales bacterium]MBO7321659.1 SPOR domain-containing protein [Bacteroidales bacterium]MBO7764257.1 SPOR domain-containing protein [Bacteroidales bacterium]MBQ2244128.1 SPOR domain-containing protein [Bacteroidales bacterium]
MKLVRLFSMFLIAATMLTSCDFFRSLVGKPTSKDLERMRIEAQAKKQRQLDSIKKAKADSLALIAAMEAEKNALKDRFYVVLGSFKVQDNADRMHKFLEKNNYTPRTIKFKNGFELVSAASTNNLQEALRILDELLEYEYCPDDVWVYDVRQELHE